uniref:Fibrinogen C-terminal domain-containing protein n=1 Tax=Macrostomum lignano TaxID=282301 RepID=A0A1I8JCT5_9PLAT
IVEGRHFYLIQQRINGSVSFARNWSEYENGFGDSSDFWIGEKIHELSGNHPRLLRIEAVAWSDALFVCEYSGFTVGDASANYKMTLDSYLVGNSNMSEDSLTYHRGMQFSTFDRDNDVDSMRHCSAVYGYGGWWYKHCLKTNPNGIYRFSAIKDASSMIWWGATTDRANALKSIRLMLRLA